MNYESLIRDFAERTRKNLRIIEEHQAKGGEAYEVTQLVNSMLGLLVFPRERSIAKIPKTSLHDLEMAGWPVPKVVGNFSQAGDLYELIRYLRNAIAHFNIEFIGEKIHSVEVWNTSPKGKMLWKAELGLEELRAIAERFTDLLLANDLPTSR
jgi:HEPN pEK499 p136